MMRYCVPSIQPCLLLIAWSPTWLHSNNATRPLMTTLLDFDFRDVFNRPQYILHTLNTTYWSTVYKAIVSHENFLQYYSCLLEILQRRTADLSSMKFRNFFPHFRNTSFTCNMSDSFVNHKILDLLKCNFLKHLLWNLVR
jgi:hypothetical protein